MSDGSHDLWRDELAAYLLGSLSDAEQRDVERHLEGCKSCREELRWLAPAIEVLPESVPAVEPPAGLRTRIMAEVEASAPRPARAPSRRAPRSLFRASILRPALALSAAALVGVVLAGQLGDGGSGGDGKGTNRSPLSATLDRRSGTLELTSLRQPPASKAYEAWVEIGSQIKPAGTFRPRANGKAHVSLQSDLDQAKVVMVTLEQRGGSLQPTGKPLVRMRLSR